MRATVAIKLDKEPGSSYTIRVSANVLPQIISGYGILQYDSNNGQLAPLLKPAHGFPALPTSNASISYASIPLTTAQGLAANATEFDPSGPNAAPYIPNPPPSTDFVAQTLFFHMSRPNATSWAINDTGLQIGMYENTERPLIWKSVWSEVVEAVQDGVGPYVNSSLVESGSVYLVPVPNTVVDLIFVVPNQDRWVPP